MKARGPGQGIWKRYEMQANEKAGSTRLQKSSSGAGRDVDFFPFPILFLDAFQNISFEDGHSELSPSVIPKTIVLCCPSLPCWNMVMMLQVVK